MTAALTLLAGAAIAVVLWAWGVRGVDGANRVAVSVVLGVAAAATNVIVPIPNVEATTTAVACAAIVLGARTGALVGMLAVVGTSVAGGVGPWTAWQVAATAGIALAMAAAARARIVRGTGEGLDLAVTAALVAILTVTYDVVVTAATLRSTGVMAGADAGDALAAAMLLGLPYTAVHVAATTAITIVAGPTLLAALRRARLRLDAIAA